MSCTSSLSLHQSVPATQCSHRRACLLQRLPGRLTRLHGTDPATTRVALPSFLQTAIWKVPLEALAAPHPGLSVGFSAATVVFVVGLPVLLAGLTSTGVLTSWLLGGLVFSAFGGGGFFLVCVYFILGSAVTKFKLKEKTEKGIAEARGGKRGPVRFYTLSHEICTTTAAIRFLGGNRHRCPFACTMNLTGASYRQVLVHAGMWQLYCEMNREALLVH